MAASKLFTPSSRHPTDCFVNPFTKPDGQNVGHADGEGGGALYPLTLGGSTQRVSSLRPPASPFKTCDDFDQE